MTQRQNPRLQELNDLLRQLSFTHDRADSREGTYWSVYVHPWVREEEGYFDALISITPRQPDRDRARGLYLAVQRGNVTWLADGVTNQRGQAWFTRLSEGRFNARLAGTPFLHSEYEEDQLPLAHVRDALAAASREGRETQQAEPRMFYLSDRRIVALLEEGTDGQATLTIETEAPDLASATVRFELAQETGEVTLTPTDPPGAWGGRRTLHSLFRAVEDTIPTFALILPQQKEKAGDDLRRD